MAHGTDAANSSSAFASKPALLADEEALIGTTLGSYKVLELLGRGGMGCVFRAKHMKLDRDVALKLLRGDYARRCDVVTRFFHEARTVNRIRHRNIVDVTDFVELADRTFIVMELLHGQRLGAWARDLDPKRVLAVLVQICEGLGAAHQIGVIHRDLKPDNVIVVRTSDGADLAKILDFGVAKLLHREDEDVGFETAAGTVIGTPAFMSPEQAGGMAIDARSDIYSLGAIMYGLFCSEPVFRGRSFGEYVRKHLNETPTPPRATAGGASIDSQLERLILRCLEKAPERRFGTIFELRDALLRLLGEIGTCVPSSRSRRAHHGRRWPRWLLGSSLAIGIGASTGAWYAHRAAPPPTVLPSVAPLPVTTPAVGETTDSSVTEKAPAPQTTSTPQADIALEPSPKPIPRRKRTVKAPIKPPAEPAALAAPIEPIADPPRASSSADKPAGVPDISPTETLDPFREKNR